MDRPATVEAWHEVVRTRDHARLDAVLADDVVFRSPAVHTPQEGRATTTAYLRAALVVLGPGLTYHREWYLTDGAVLEFTTSLAGADGREVEVHGVDVLRWDADGRITDFTVMVRPLKALGTLVEHMGAELQRAAGQG